MFSIVVVVLNILFAIAMPSNTAVLFEGETQEYSVADADVAIAHTVRLEGTLTTKSFRPTEFEGQLTLDGMTWVLCGIRTDEVWSMELTAPESLEKDAPRILEVRGNRELTSVTVRLEGEEGLRFLSLHAGNRAAALRSFQTYFEDCVTP